MTINRRGISPVIAILLLVAVAVVLGLIVYAWAAGWVASTTKGTEAAKGQFKVEYAVGDDSDDLFTIWIRNIGGVTVRITDAYIEKPDGTLDKGSIVQYPVVMWSVTTNGGESITKVTVTTTSIDESTSSLDVNIDYTTDSNTQNTVVTITITFSTGPLVATFQKTGITLPDGSTSTTATLDLVGSLSGAASGTFTDSDVISNGGKLEVTYSAVYPAPHEVAAFDIKPSSITVDEGKVYTLKIVASDGSITFANVRAKA